MEKCFCQNLLGFSFNNDRSEKKESPAVSEKADSSVSRGTDSAADPESSDEESSNLHLMNSIAPVFTCDDPLKTALFYETKLGFHAADNIEIILAKGKEDETVSRSSSLYDLYIFVSEPMMLQMELQNAGVTVIKVLEDSDTVHTNREFVIEDIDGRRICFSQRISG